MTSCKKRILHFTTLANTACVRRRGWWHRVSSHTKVFPRSLQGSCQSKASTTPPVTAGAPGSPARAPATTTSKPRAEHPPRTPMAHRGPTYHTEPGGWLWEGKGHLGMSFIWAPSTGWLLGSRDFFYYPLSLFCSHPWNPSPCTGRFLPFSQQCLYSSGEHVTWHDPRLKLIELTTNPHQKNSSQPAPIIIIFKLYAPSFFLFLLRHRTLCDIVKYWSIDFNLSRFLRIVSIMSIHHLKLDFLQIKQIQKLRLPLGSKQGGLFLLSWWTRNVTGKNEHPEKCQEFPSSTDHMEMYCKWNNRLKWSKVWGEPKQTVHPSSLPLLQLWSPNLEFHPEKDFWLHVSNPCRHIILTAGRRAPLGAV